MKTSAWLYAAQTQLQEAGIGTARLDALVLLEDVLSKDRAWLLANPDYEIPTNARAKLKKLLNRRSLHEPLAYIRGKTEFYGREFVVTHAVLEPRPESETMIDILKAMPDLPPRARIADVGTGSGALGITAKLELPESAVELRDIDADALKIAKTNVDKFTLDISVMHSDLIEGLDSTYDLLLCNLPYVPDDFQINAAASHEPKIAVFGGADGLNLYRKLFGQLKEVPSRVLYILSESLPTQHKQLQQIAASAHYQMVEERDFIQVFRHSSSGTE